MWPVRTITFFGLFVVMCILSLVNPLVGVVNYMMIYQVNPTTSWWGVPLNELGIRFSMLAALSLGIGMILNWERLPKVRPLLCTWQILLITLVGVAVLSRWIGLEVTNWPTGIVLEKFIKLSIFVLCVTHLVSNRKNFHVLLWTIVCGSLLLGYDAYSAPRWEFIRGRLQSVGGPDFRASSGLAAHTAAMLPLIGVAALSVKKWRWKLLAGLSGALTFNALVLCRTRSAFIGLIATGVVAVLLAPRAMRLKVYAALIIAMIASYSLTDGYFWDRMNTLQDDEYMEQDIAVSLRKEVWAAAFAMIADKPQGVGCGNFRRVIERWDMKVRYRASHNTFIVCCAELGIHGAMIFLLLIMTTFVQLYECRGLAKYSSDPPGDRLIVYGMTLSIIAYMVTGLFTERFYVESFWWVLAMPTCFSRALNREVAERVLEPELQKYAPNWNERGLLPA